MASNLRVDTILPSTGTSLGIGTASGTTTVTNNLSVTNNLTATGSINAASATITGNLGVGGVLTYEDVTNVDSVGLITARSGLNVSGGEVKVGTAVTVSSGGVITSGIVTATTFEATTFQKTPTNTPAFFAYWNANNSQTISNTTDTKATWLTSEMFDTDNAYNTSTQTFTVPAGKDGVYVFNAGVQMYSNGNSLRTVIIRLRKNGSGTWAASQYSQVMNADENRMRHHQAHLFTMLNLAAGDTIELICWGRVLNNSLYISNDASGVKSNFLSGYKLIF